MTFFNSNNVNESLVVSDCNHIENPTFDQVLTGVFSHELQAGLNPELHKVVRVKGIDNSPKTSEIDI